MKVAHRTQPFLGVPWKLKVYSVEDGFFYVNV